MSLNRYAKRRDENEADIVKALESIGCTVYPLDMPCDLLCARGGFNILLEIKNPAKPKKDRQKTKMQKRFFASWNGQVDVAETSEQAIAVVQRVTGRI